MYISTSDPADRSFYLRNYDNALLTLLKVWLREGDTALDCGAQKGYVSLHLARAVGTSGKVYAFEPDYRARDWLKKHLLLNAVGNVAVVEQALGEKDEVATFHLSSQLGWSTCHPNHLAAATITESLEVRVTSLDKLIETNAVSWRAGSLSWIKIDCEGSEVAVLQGMSRVLGRESPLLWIEVNSDALRVAGSKSSDLVQDLSGLGYQIYIPELSYTFIGQPRMLLRRIVEAPDVPLCDIVALKDHVAQSKVAALRPVVTFV
jgi:FkbM family methyltransferase